MHAANRLHVVRDDLWSRVADGLYRLLVALEITDQNLNRHLGAGIVHAANCLSPDVRTAIGKFVAVHTGDDDMLELHQFQRCSNATRLVEIERGRLASFDVAETTRARADVAENHDRCRAAAPALAHVGARRLLANGVQLVLINDRLQPLVTLSTRHSRAQPVGLALNAEVVDGLLAIVDHERCELESRRAGGSLSVSTKRTRMARNSAGNGVGRWILRIYGLFWTRGNHGSRSVGDPTAR